MHHSENVRRFLDDIRKQLPDYNQFSYWEVASLYGSGSLSRSLKDHFGDEEKVVIYKQTDETGTKDGLKTFLGKGR